MKNLIYILVLVLSVGAPAQEQPMTLFDKATKAYNEGNYEAAAENYEAILAQGSHSAEVYFNLGNAYYKMNRVGPSIYNYEKALLLAPEDAEIKNNLVFARNMTLDNFTTLEEPVVSRVLRGIPAYYSADRWAVISLVFIALFVAAFIAFRFLYTPFAKRMTFIASMLFLLLGLTSIFLAYQQQKAYNEDQPAIIMAEVVRVKSEPNARGQLSFELHEGTKVEVTESLDDWRKIRVSNGNTGWIPASDLRLIKDF